MSYERGAARRALARPPKSYVDGEHEHFESRFDAPVPVERQVAVDAL